MKKLIFAIILVSFVWLITSCGLSAPQENPNTQITDSKTNQNAQESETTYNPSSAKDPLLNPYVDSLGLNPNEKAKALDWNTIISGIFPYDYELYPGYPTKPLKATLYKDGEVVELEVTDTRLIQMTNFYYNELHHGVYAHTTGSFSTETVASMVDSASTYLEIEYDPNSYYLDESVDFYTGFDKLIVLPGVFIAIDSDSPYGGGCYPSTAFGRYPLSVTTVDWLAVFGFRE